MSDELKADIGFTAGPNGYPFWPGAKITQRAPNPDLLGDWDSEPDEDDDVVDRMEKRRGRK